MTTMETDKRFTIMNNIQFQHRIETMGILMTTSDLPGQFQAIQENQVVMQVFHQANQQDRTSNQSPDIKTRDSNNNPP